MAPSLASLVAFAPLTSLEHAAPNAIRTSIWSLHISLSLIFSLAHACSLALCRPLAWPFIVMHVPRSRSLTLLKFIDACVMNWRHSSTRDLFRFCDANKWFALSRSLTSLTSGSPLLRSLPRSLARSLARSPSRSLALRSLVPIGIVCRGLPEKVRWLRCCGAIDGECVIELGTRRPVRLFGRFGRSVQSQNSVRRTIRARASTSDGHVPNLGIRLYHGIMYRAHQQRGGHSFGQLSILHCEHSSFNWARVRCAYRTSQLPVGNDIGGWNCFVRARVRVHTVSRAEPGAVPHCR